MPDNTYPPFGDNAGAFTVPRQLNRWLDVNPQGGALRRCQTTITLPAFTAADEWNGYSDIVTSFNFEAENNFSLTLPLPAPTSPNYVLCISYRIGTAIARYLLWDADGSVLNQQIPTYTGQPILKNFRLEVWNTSQGASSQSADIDFITSKLQNIDYRYGTDAALVENDGQVTTFEDSAQSTAVSAPSTNLLAQFRADTGVSGTDWTAMVDNVHVTPESVTTDGDVSTSVSIANQAFFTNPFGTNTDFTKGSLANFADAITAYIVFRINALEDKKEIFSFGKSTDPTVIFSLRINTDGTFGVYNAADTLVGSVSTLVCAAGDWLVAAVICYPAVNIFVAGVSKLEGDVDLPLPDLGSNAVTVATPINFVSFDGKLTSANTSVAEVLIYSDYNVQSDVINYIWQRYVTTYSLPLTFPTTSVSVTN